MALAQAAEEAGFESPWTVEHTVVPAGFGDEVIAPAADLWRHLGAGRDLGPELDGLIGPARRTRSTTTISP